MGSINENRNRIIRVSRANATHGSRKSNGTNQVNLGGLPRGDPSEAPTPKQLHVTALQNRRHSVHAKATWAWCFVMGAIVCFCFGIALPAFRLQLRLFDTWLNLWVEWFSGPLDQEHSLLEGIWTLAETGETRNLILAIVLFSFSILFPVIKLSVIVLALKTRSQRLSKPTSAVSLVGYFSMLDVFVIAVIVANFQVFPGGTRIIPLIGIYLFATSVVLGIVAGHLTKKLLFHVDGEYHE